MSHILKIELSLKNYCIHTAAKKCYERAISQYFKKNQSNHAHIEKEIDNLKYFLENADVGQIRSIYPELSGKSRMDVNLLIADQPKKWQIQFLDQIVDVIWK
jgi:pentose-5-phosphate-3-epimerase